MALYKQIINKFTGDFTLVRADTAFHMKDNVSTHSNLPITGNSENDVRITQDTDLMYTWSISASSGSLSDWKQIGSASTVDWSAITNKPTSPVTDIDDAVSKKHSQNTDTEINLTASPSSDHSATGTKCSFTAGEALVFGDVCYIKSDGKLWKADADAESTSYAVAMSLATISADASGEVLLFGIVRDDSWAWTVGSPIYLSTTAGSLTQTAPSGSGDIVQIMGVATHADRMYFKPELVQVEVS